VVNAGGTIDFDTVYQTVDQPAAGNGLLVQLSEGPSMTMAGLDVSNNTVISGSLCSHCNWLVGFYDDDSASSQNVSVRNNYGDPTGVMEFTGSPWFANAGGPGISTPSNLAHPMVMHGLANMVSGAQIPVPSVSSKTASGYWTYPDASSYSPSLSDIFTNTSSPSSGNVITSQVVTISANMAQAKGGWIVTGTPKINLNSGGAATYSGGSGTSTLTFSYTVGSGDSTSNLTITSFNLNGGSIKDGLGNTAVLTGPLTAFGVSVNAGSSLTLTSVPTTAGLGAPIPVNTPLVFDDEFQGSTLNASNWTQGWFPATPSSLSNFGSSEQAAFGPTQVVVSNGLSLNAISQTNVVNGVTYNFLSGLITSTGPPNYGSATPWLQQFTYGYFEAKLTNPETGSSIYNWPAWWLNSLNNPTTGEIDIMEGLGQGSGGAGIACSTFHYASGFSQTCPPGNYGGTHIFAAWWTPSTITWYYDNVQVGQVTSNVTSSPMYMVLNYAMENPGPGGPSVVPNTMSVLAVHVFQTGGTPVAPQTGYAGPGFASVPFNFSYGGSAPTGMTCTWTPGSVGGGTVTSFTASGGTGSGLCPPPSTAGTYTMSATGTGPNTSTGSAPNTTVVGTPSSSVTFTSFANARTSFYTSGSGTYTGSAPTSFTATYGGGCSGSSTVTPSFSGGTWAAMFTTPTAACTGTLTITGTGANTGTATSPSTSFVLGGTQSVQAGPYPGQSGDPVGYSAICAGPLTTITSWTPNATYHCIEFDAGTSSVNINATGVTIVGGYLGSSTSGNQSQEAVTSSGAVQPLLNYVTVGPSPSVAGGSFPPQPPGGGGYSSWPSGTTSVSSTLGNCYGVLSNGSSTPAGGYTIINSDIWGLGNGINFSQTNSSNPINFSNDWIHDPMLGGAQCTHTDGIGDVSSAGGDYVEDLVLDHNTVAGATNSNGLAMQFHSGNNAVYNNDSYTNNFWAGSGYTIDLGLCSTCVTTPVTNIVFRGNVIGPTPTPVFGQNYGDWTTYFSTSGSGNFWRLNTYLGGDYLCTGSCGTPIGNVPAGYYWYPNGSANATDFTGPD
jgi:hypothetical protein